MKVRLTAVLGAVLAVVGLAALAVPQLTARLPTGETVVSILGGLLVLGGLREVGRRRNASPEYAETSDTEQTMDLPTPGADVDRRIDQIGTTAGVATRTRLREEMTDIAVATLQRRFGYTEAEAEAAIYDRTWSDDPYAVAFFSGKAPQVDTLTQLREFVRPGTSFKNRARRAVDELSRLADGEEVSDDE